ncbi:MAG: DUF2087 domain-containing protein [bacterium]|nr:DUF2087 domain-containing protein [bacterium]
MATILRLKPATISHHLAKLSEAGLLESRKDQYYQIYSLVGNVLKKPLEEIVRLPQPGLKEEVEEDAYRNKVLRTFMVHGRLPKLPAQLKKKLIIFEKLAQEFEPGRKYPEHEVNVILLDFNEDVATLRRGLVDHRFLARAKGIYWRVEEEVEEGG